MSNWYRWWCLPWAATDRETPPTPEQVTLRDGTQAWIRPIVPSDRELHAANYERLSDDSKFSRFLTTVPHLTEKQLDRLVDDVDGVDHIAYYLFVDDDSALPVAIGRIVRDPDHPDAADIAVTVHDGWQGRGIGTTMVRVLIERRPAGVTRLLTVVHWKNTASRKMLRSIGPTQEVPIGEGALEVRIDLTGLDDPAAPAPEDPTLTPVAAAWREALHTRDQVFDWLP